MKNLPLALKVSKDEQLSAGDVLQKCCICESYFKIPETEILEYCNICEEPECLKASAETQKIMADKYLAETSEAEKVIKKAIG